VHFVSSACSTQCESFCCLRFGGNVLCCDIDVEAVLSVWVFVACAKEELALSNIWVVEKVVDGKVGKLGNAGVISPRHNSRCIVSSPFLFKPLVLVERAVVKQGGSIDIIDIVLYVLRYKVESTVMLLE